MQKNERNIKKNKQSGKRQTSSERQAVQKNNPQGRQRPKNTEPRMPQRAERQQPQNTGQRQPPRPQLFDQKVAPLATPKQGSGPTEMIFPMSISTEAPMSAEKKRQMAQASAPYRRRQPKRATPQKQEKRITRGEARRRRFRRRLFWGILLTAVILVGIVLTVTLLFKIEKYTLEGDSPYAIDELTLAFGHEVGENIFLFNQTEEQKKVGQALPYIEEINIGRRLPSTVVFKVTPATETYYTACQDGGFAVLSKGLKVLRLSAEAPQGLPLLVGVDPVLPKAGYMLEMSEPEKQESLNNVLAAIEEIGLFPYTQLDITSAYEISFIYDGRIRVILGTANTLDDKLAVAANVINNHIGATEKGKLDVSHQSPDKNRQAVFDPGEI